MRRLAVGDIQGCLDPLLRVLEQARFDPACDELWSVGDLVNRGPRSLATLRWFRELGGNARIVLGNHDLHLLAVAEGIRPLKRGDTLQQILDAPDASDLLEWLRRLPLVHHDRPTDTALVHAGLAPEWSAEEAKRLSDEVAAALQGPGYRDFLTHMYGDTPDRWDDELTGSARLRVITNYCTRMRYCRADGSLDLNEKGAPDAAPDELTPWFRMPRRVASNTTVVFGHWASLMGRVDNPRLVALDTGCVWGQQMTLVDLATRQRWSCPCAGQS